MRVQWQHLTPFATHVALAVHKQWDGFRRAVVRLFGGVDRQEYARLDADLFRAKRDYASLSNAARQMASSRPPSLHVYQVGGPTVRFMRSYMDHVEELRLENYRVAARIDDSAAFAIPEIKRTYLHEMARQLAGEMLDHAVIA